jgi:transposase, IS5 family
LLRSSFADPEYAAKKKQTRRDCFLTESKAVTPRAALEGEIEPFYPKDKGRGRPPMVLRGC